MKPPTIATSHFKLLDALDSGSPAACREAIDYHIGVARHFVVKGVGETGDSSDEDSADEDVLPL